jgi:threonine dehydrogenase-like Zn-dependent dehydrogenase
MVAKERYMQAVVFKGKLQVAVEQRPMPKILSSQDIIVKIRYTALCGRYVMAPPSLKTHFRVASISQIQYISSHNFALTVSFMFSGAINHLKRGLLWATSSRAK